MLCTTVFASAILDILGLSITGILVVMFGLILLATIVFLFKFVIPGVDVKAVQSAKKTESVAKAKQEQPEKLDKLDEDQLAAIVTALAIEWKLYHQDVNDELPFEFESKKISAWTMSDYLVK